MKKIHLILILLTLSIFSSHSIKFYLDRGDSTSDATADKLTIQAIFDLGFSIEGIVSNSIGLTDYQGFFFKPAFHVDKFGIGLDLKFRFRVFPDNFEFRTADWYVEGDALETAFLYLDKISYIKYGDMDSFIYASTGELPYITFGNGLLVNNFHNYSFLPTSRENGLYFNFRGEKLEKVNLPLEASFFIPDLLDPDIYALNVNFDILKFLKRDRFSLKAGFAMSNDFNATESNLLSADSVGLIGKYRNNEFTTALIGLSIPVNFKFTHRIFQIEASNELAFMINPPLQGGTTGFGLADEIYCEARFINIKNSGFLLGAILGMVIRYGDFYQNYYSTNYQIVRQKQYRGQNENFNLFIKTGIALYALDEDLRFRLTASIPVVTDQFKVKLETSFVYEGRSIRKFIPGLSTGIYFETALTALNFQGGTDGGLFLETLTRDFRFSFQLGYNIFGAKMNFLIGVQRASWSIFDNYIVGNSFSTNNFSKDLQKFVGVEVSFVF